MSFDTLLAVTTPSLAHPNILHNLSLNIEYLLLGCDQPFLHSRPTRQTWPALSAPTKVSTFPPPSRPPHEGILENDNTIRLVCCTEIWEGGGVRGEIGTKVDRRMIQTTERTQVDSQQHMIRVTRLRLPIQLHSLTQLVCMLKCRYLSWAV